MEPIELFDQILPSIVEAPTAITPGIFAGIDTSLMFAFWPLLPAAATTKIPASNASFTASTVSDWRLLIPPPGSPPKLRLMISTS